MTQPAIQIPRYALPAMVSALLLGMIYFIVFHYPGNMDEHSLYHALACWNYPAARIYNGGFYFDCYTFRLWLNGIQVWDRSFFYLGITQSLLYAPFYYLWNSPYSAHIFGMVAYMVTAWGAARLLRLPLLAVVVALGSNYMLLFSMVRDTGTVITHLLATVAIPLLIKQVMEAKDRRRYIWLSIALGLLVFAAFEAKPFFVYMLPGIAILTLCAYPEWLRQDKLILLVKRLWPAAALALVLITFLLSLSISPYRHVSYAKILMGRGEETLSSERYLNKLYFTTHCILQMTNTSSFLKRSGYTHCMWKPKFKDGMYAYARGFSSLYLLAVIIVVGTCMWERRDKRNLLGGLIIAGLVSLLTLSMHSKVLQAHHLFLPWFMWSLALAVALSSFNPPRFMLLLCCLGLGCAYANSFAQPTRSTGWSRWPVMRMIDKPEVASRAMVVNLQWGTYFTSSLYGPKDQFEVLLRDFDRNTLYTKWQMLNYVSEIARIQGRVPLFVGFAHSPQWGTVKHRFPRMRQLYPPRGKPANWVIWGDPSMRDALYSRD